MKAGVFTVRRSRGAFSVMTNQAHDAIEVALLVARALETEQLIFWEVAWPALVTRMGPSTTPYSHVVAPSRCDRVGRAFS